MGLGTGQRARRGNKTHTTASGRKRRKRLRGFPSIQGRRRGGSDELVVYEKRGGLEVAPPWFWLLKQASPWRIFFWLTWKRGKREEEGMNESVLEEDIYREGKWEGRGSG